MPARTLNELCLCLRSDPHKLRDSLRASGLADLPGANATPLFAEFPVFIEQGELESIVAIVEGIGQVAHNPAFVDHALSHAPALARVDQGTLGVLYGYDFHLTESGPKLIEVNTNAGGLLLNDALCQAQAPCCEAASPLLRYPVDPRGLRQALVESFHDEFRRVRGPESKLTSVAIVDENPKAQFLYPEFELFAALFERAGVAAYVVDPRELEYRDGKLWKGGAAIDLVYNRLTDFYLQQPAHAHLAAAYTSGAVVLTPHPRAHALFANKHHLATWGDAQQLRAWGIAEPTIAVLTAGIPKAEIVDATNRARLWSERKRYFFKPARGYASKAAYRGDKITKTTWEQQVSDGYLAQEVIRPSERMVRVQGELVKLKLDVRAYVDQERVVLLAARLYQGQTTNFRTPGGGFATILASPMRSPLALTEGCRDGTPECAGGQSIVLGSAVA